MSAAALVKLSHVSLLCIPNVVTLVDEMLRDDRAGTPLAGFMRVMHLLAHHPWRLRPLLVDSAGELTSATAAGAQRSFDKVRLLPECTVSSTFPVQLPSWDKTA